MFPKDPFEVENMVDLLFDEASHKLIARILCQKGFLSKQIISEIEQELSKKHKKEFKLIKKNLIELIKRIEVDIKNHLEEKQNNKIKEIEKISHNNNLNTYFIGEVPREYVRTGSVSNVKEIEIITDMPSLFKNTNITSSSQKGLTIDSILLKAGTNEIFDPTDRGIDDILNQRISSILPPKDAIKQNPLTIFRTIRLAGRTGFEIDNNLKKAISNLNGNINNVERERIDLEILSLSKKAETKRILSELKLI